MPKRTPSDKPLVQKRLSNDLKVLKFCLDNIQELAHGGLESPQKLMLFYAGYTAMRSIWDVKTSRGKVSTGDPDLDDELKNDPGKFIFRVNMEISHSIGEHTSTLLRVNKFKFWAKTFLAHWGQDLT